MKGVYTCGRMHKPARKAKLGAVKSNALLEKFFCIMKLDTTTREIVSMLQDELLSAKFESEAMNSKFTTRVPLLWSPSKPNVTMALIDVLTNGHDTDDAHMLPCAGSSGVTKLLTRHMVETMLQTKGIDWLKQCGELTSAQLESPTRTNRTLSRVAFDLIVYVHARAEEIRQIEGGELYLSYNRQTRLCVAEI